MPKVEIITAPNLAGLKEKAEDFFEKKELDDAIAVAGATVIKGVLTPCVTITYEEDEVPEKAERPQQESEDSAPHPADRPTNRLHTDRPPPESPGPAPRATTPAPERPPMQHGPTGRGPTPTPPGPMGN